MRDVSALEQRGADIEALRGKYRIERNKRLRAEGTGQYVQPDGPFAHFLDDPYIEARIERRALTEEVDVALIGGGYVFQRTPSSVDARNNYDTDSTWSQSLPRGWQRRRRDNFNILMNGGQQDEDLVRDGWTAIVRNIGRPGLAAGPEAMRARELADFANMEQIRSRIAAIVKDPATAEAFPIASSRAVVSSL
jgi:hypothetical protein